MYIHTNYIRARVCAFRVHIFRCWSSCFIAGQLCGDKDVRTDGLYNYLQSYKSRRRRPAEPIKMSENYYARGKHDSHPSHLIAAPATINPLPPTVAPRRVRRTTAKSFFFPTSPPTRRRRPRRRFIRPCYFIDSTSLGRELGPRGGEYIFFSFISRYSLDTSFPGTKSRPHTISEYSVLNFVFFHLIVAAAATISDRHYAPRSENDRKVVFFSSPLTTRRDRPADILFYW